MRFAIPPSSARGRIFAINPKDWPLSLRFVLLIIPFGICIGLAATWVGYKAASPVLHDSLSSVPLLEAKMQAEKMEKILTDLRRSIFMISKTGNITEQAFKESLRLFFHDNEDLIQEIGFKDAQQNGFLLLRDRQDFIKLNASEASYGLYSPFQQLGTLSMTPGQATLYPPVYFDDPTHIARNQSGRSPVMRMAMPLPDESGTLVVGVSFAGLCKRLGASLQPGSSLRLPAQEGAFQMAFFFDIRGWILFEVSNTGNKAFLPDLSREGYLGDLGRPGYDAAFRPWAAHENFWRMVTDTQAGKSGSVPAPADKYSVANVGATGMLCFAPVAFAPTEESPASVHGGIAFFETSTLPLSAFLRLANYSIAIMIGAIVLSALLAFRVNKKFAVPLARMARDLKSVSDSGDLAFINIDPASEEQNRFQTAVNAIIAGAMHTRNQLERLNSEVEHTRSRLPVDLRQGGETVIPGGEFGMVGSSALVRELREHVHKAARAGTDVLVWGETGTGKELVAAAIHKASARHDGPYISINCGALDENLLLDTLFGHVKGAFTEAKTDRKGAFLAAHGGTLHLDEIANASLKVQQSLLRALSVRRIRPLGTDEDVPFNTRVVAATNVDLRECVRAGTFREDLYYRLAIISIETPPLRHRKEDIPELAVFCIHDAAVALGRPEARLSRGALDLMYAYDWPGNVREFKNCLTRAMAFVEGDLILVQHITLEQDAFHTYTKPLPHTAGAAVYAAYRGSHPSHARKSERDINAPAPTRVDAATGPAQVAESLFPPPPREKFTPARKPGDAGHDGAEPGQAMPQVVPPPSAERQFPQDRQTQAPLAHTSNGQVAPAATASGPVASGSGYHETAPAGSGAVKEMPYQPVPQSPFASFRAGAPLPTAAPGTESVQPRPDAPRTPASPSLEGLNDRQLRALDFAREHGRISRPQYEDVAGADVSARTLQNDLRELVERSIFKRIGAGPATCYELEEASDRSR